jgi:hypothetical protein
VGSKMAQTASPSASIIPDCRSHGSLQHRRSVSIQHQPLRVLPRRFQGVPVKLVAQWSEPMRSWGRINLVVAGTGAMV